MPRKKTTPAPVTTEQAQTALATVVPDPSAALVAALVQAINATKPVEKKNAMNRKAITPWTPKDGSPKLKFKRKTYQHGLPVDPDYCTNVTIELWNKLRPGVFMDGWVKVTRRRDRGIDITYPVKTASQRLKLVNQYGIRHIDDLLERCIVEADNPAKYAPQEVDQ
jgi:hypothetical protein